MWLKVDPHLRDHPKTVRLRTLLNDPHVVEYLINLWSWVLLYKPGGDLSGHSNEDLAHVMGYEGDPDALANGLLTCSPDGLGSGFLDGAPGKFRCHDWEDWGGSYDKYTKSGRRRWKDWDLRRRSPNGSLTVSKQAPNRLLTCDRRGEEIKTLTYTDRRSDLDLGSGSEDLPSSADLDLDRESFSKTAAKDSAPQAVSGKSSKVRKSRAVSGNWKDSEGPAAQAAADAAHDAIEHPPELDHDVTWLEDRMWAFELWQGRYKGGSWSKKDWTLFAAGRKALSGQVTFRKSWASYLKDDDPFYAGHYPGKWSSTPARWLRPKKGTLEAIVEKNREWIPPEERVP